MESKDVTLKLPGNMTFFDIKWIAIYDIAQKGFLAALRVPKAKKLNVPPSYLPQSEVRANINNERARHIGSTNLSIKSDVPRPIVSKPSDIKIALQELIKSLQSLERGWRGAV